MTHVTDANCIFCKIVAGDIPSYKVYEDEHFFAFLDIHPVKRGHTLLIPKNHIGNILDSKDQDSTVIFQNAKNLAKKYNQK